MAKGKDHEVPALLALESVRDEIYAWPSRANAKYAYQRLNMDLR